MRDTNFELDSVRFYFYNDTPWKNIFSKNLGFSETIIDLKSCNSKTGLDINISRYVTMIHFINMQCAPPFVKEIYIEWRYQVIVLLARFFPRYVIYEIFSHVENIS